MVFRVTKSMEGSTVDDVTCPAGVAMATVDPLPVVAVERAR